MVVRRKSADGELVPSVHHQEADADRNRQRDGNAPRCLRHDAGGSRGRRQFGHDTEDTCGGTRCGRYRPGAAFWSRRMGQNASPTRHKSLYDPHMRRTRASARWMRFALAFALALGLAVVSGAAQQVTILTNGRNLQIPINHGLPDKPLGFTFCRLRYQNIRRARKSGWGDDYPQADYNFMVRLAELTRTTISRWNNGDPGFANVTAMDPDLFRCPYLRMQNAANYDFTPEETARMHDYLLKGGFLWIDDNWDPDFEYIRPNLMRILPGAKIVDLPVEHPMFSVLYRVNPLPQIPSLGSWLRNASGFRDRAFNRALLRCVRRPRQAACARQHELGRFRQLGAGRRQPGLLRDLLRRRAMRWV